MLPYNPHHVEVLASEVTTSQRTRPPGLINQILGNNWPGLLQISPALVTLVGVTPVPVAFRVWRLLGEPHAGFFSQAEHAAAKALGREGWWQKVTWGNLVTEILKDPVLPMHPSKPIPKETGLRKSELWAYTTCLDGWAHHAAITREKSHVYHVAPDGPSTTGLLVEAGAMAEGGVASPDPLTVSKVIVTVRMLIVPYRGMYSLGVEIRELARGVGALQATTQVSETVPGGSGKKTKFKFSLRRRKTTDN